MEKPPTDEKRDLLKEDYKGTGAAVSALGLGAIETKIGILAGVAAGGIGGVLVPEHINSFAEKSKHFAEGILLREKEKPGLVASVKRFCAGTVKQTFKFADTIATGVLGHFTHSGPELHVKQEQLNIAKKAAILKRFDSFGPKAMAMFTAGGVLGLVGLVVSLITGTAHGIDSARGGKSQFDEAKKEIKNLRDEKEALATEVEKLGKELAKTKAEVHAHAATHGEKPSKVISNAEHADKGVHHPTHAHSHEQHHHA